MLNVVWCESADTSNTFIVAGESLDNRVREGHENCENLRCPEQQEVVFFLKMSEP